jgi:uncharacterized circularly permuted ATP-grasp superfamily protein/uncharacterized alpha-E superfamily protein
MSAHDPIENAPLAAFLQNYVPMEGVPDELLDDYGNVRPVWQNFIDFLSGLSTEDMEKRFARGDQYLRDAGVFYRQYDDEEGSSERNWPLSHIPILIEEQEWKEISRGLIQRADLLETIVQDLYGTNNLVANGHIPAELISGSPEWLRPMVGTKPRSGHFLNFTAFEIGRGPDGRWWVLGDRTQAPSGAGFAIENRMATSRIFPDFYARSNTYRLANFFKIFRDTLNGLSNDNDCGVGILTPGRLNDTYFEHAYIARYLGFMLLEGEDITIREGKVMVRTVSGLKPISVLWRRLDANYSDPLELNKSSKLGTPGLVEAIRQGNVTLLNALGTGVLETKAMLAFIPRICKALRNEPLLLPNIATWWCGQKKELTHVLNNTKNMMIGPALSTSLPFDKDEMQSLLAIDQNQQQFDRIVDNGAKLVAQEAVTLSTTPAYVDGKIVPRPMTLRVFLARTNEGWKVMPGGYARIGKNKDAAAIAMQNGGSVADVWIVSDCPVENATLLHDPSRRFERSERDALPSRAGDNLFWLGRYIERAESYMRLTRAYHIRLAESGNPDAPILQSLSHYLEDFSIELDDDIPQAICDTLSYAIISAGHIRDRFSVDGWMALNDLSETAVKFRKRTQPGGDTAEALRVLVRKVTGFSGLVHESMYHSTGWRLMCIGRDLERAYSMSSILAHFTDPISPDGALDLVVEVGDSMMTHLRRYVVATNRETVVDLLALDDQNPRSIIYQLNEVREHLRHLPALPEHGHMSDLSRAALKLQSALATNIPEELSPEFFKELCGSINQLCNLLSLSYLK